MHGIRLQLLCAPSISCDSGAIHLKRRKSLALLAFLALEPRAHSRDELATLLWPSRGQASARNNLRQSLHALRAAIGRDGLLCRQDTVELAPRALIVDVEEFRELSAGCASHDSDSACAECASNLERATDLYRDDLLTGFNVPDSSLYDEWQLAATEALRIECASVLARLASFHEQSRAWGASLRFARRLLSMDPLEEHAQRMVMRVLAQAGRPIGAMRQYWKSVSILERELDLPPEPETDALFEAIRMRRFPSS